MRLAACLALIALPASAQAETYLRAGVAYERSSQTGFRDVDCRQSGALFGCGAGPDGQPRSARGDFGSTAAGELGAGYRLSTWFRVEALATWRPGLDFTGRTNFADAPVRADMSSLSTLAAIYADLGLYGRMRPFLGAGLGAARNRLGSGLGAAGTTTSTAWMATAGVAWPLSNRTTLDVAYRYTDLGQVRSGAPAVRADVVAQGVSASVRWGF